MSKEVIGTLVVVVLKARHLRDKHSFYKQDPYASVSLNGVTKKTKADHKGGQHPVWDEELRFPVYKDAGDLHRSLKVECWSKEPKADDMVGQGKINIEETLTVGEFDDWIQMYEPSGQARGEVYLEMTFYAAGPPPVRRPSKLHPNDRLSRPQQYHPLQPIADKPQSVSPTRPPPQLQPHHPQAPPAAKTHSHSESYSSIPSRPITSSDGYLAPQGSPPGPRSPSRTPPKDPNSPLPPVPDALRPTARAPVKDVPSILRPGAPSANHSPGRRSGSPSPPVPPEDPINARYPSPSRGPGLAASVAASAYPPAPDPYFTNAQITSNAFTFPLPQVPQVPQAVPATYESPYAPRTEPELPDPYLQSRYQTPLPLPSEPCVRPVPAVPTAVQDESYLLTPKAPHSQASEAERIAKELARVEREEEEKRRRQEEERRRRQEEEDEALAKALDRERKRQEEEDEALAKALDKELNAALVEETTRGRTGMPGAW